MTIPYMIYQAERPVSRSERHAADAIRGGLAGALSSLLHGGRGRGRDRRVAGGGQCPASEVPDYVPAEWTTAGTR
jgi:hypothetical protein